MRLRFYLGLGRFNESGWVIDGFREEVEVMEARVRVSLL